MEERYTVVWLSRSLYDATEHDENSQEGPSVYDREQVFDTEAQARAFAASPACIDDLQGTDGPSIYREVRVYEDLSRPIEEAWEFDQWLTHDP